MKFKYFEEEMKEQEITCYIMALIILIAGIIGNTKSPINQMEKAYIFLSIEWFESMIWIILAVIFVIYFGRLFAANRKNFKKWYIYLMKNGIVCNGKIIEIRFIRKNLFQLKVNYYSKLTNKEMEVYLPHVFIPNLDITNKNLVCDIYEILEQHKDEDYTSELIQVDAKNGKVYFHLNPFKLFANVRKIHNKKWFGSVIAVNFRYDN